MEILEGPRGETTISMNAMELIVGKIQLVLFLGVLACCLLPLLLLGGGLVILSFLIQRETWFVLVTVLVFGLALYAVYRRRKKEG